MRRVTFPRYASLVLALVVPMVGCADRRSPSESEITAHPPEWTQTMSVDFHGQRVLERGIGTCGECHGANLRGSADINGCYECHDGAGGHPYGWARPAEMPFHGDAFVSEGPGSCRSCHGADSRGGWSEVSCFGCHAGGPSGHPAGWMDSQSASFHGRRAGQEGFGDCRRCHGNDLEGGISEVACSTCHQ